MGGVQKCRIIISCLSEIQGIKMHNKMFNKSPKEASEKKSI
jgi:hypothetical protein